MGTKCSQQQEASVRRGGEAENVLRVSFPREVKILKDEVGVGGGINFRLLLSGGRRIVPVSSGTSVSHVPTNINSPSDDILLYDFFAL